jgi:N utilization substance protein B
MQGIRRQGRSFALQLLFQIDITGDSGTASLERFWLTVDASQKARAFAMQLARAVIKHQAEIDRILTANLENWKLSRLSVVVRNILRLAVCELLVLRLNPPPIVINEAVELTYSFMDEESAPFVNSVLERCRLAEESAATAAPPPAP